MAGLEYVLSSWIVADALTGVLMVQGDVRKYQAFELSTQTPRLEEVRLRTQKLSFGMTIRMGLTDSTLLEGSNVP